MSLMVPSTGYPESSTERDRWILARRPARVGVDVRRPHAFLIERERAADGEIADVTTIFLTGRECPWRCLMCDLWKNTTEERTPVGAILAQIDFALAGLGRSQREEVLTSLAANDGDNSVRQEHPNASLSTPARPPQHIKLYNSGSFFDRAAIPLEDYEFIVRRAAGFERVIVESHPALIGDLTLRFRDLLLGAADLERCLSSSMRVAAEVTRLTIPSASKVRASSRRLLPLAAEPQLEVAMGLETVHPEVLGKLNKRVTLEQFASAAAFLKREGIALRVFVLVKPPFMDEGEALTWAVRSAQFAFDCGAEVVSLIPTRLGNGALEALAAQGQFTRPRLTTLEAAFEQSLGSRRGRVFADVWDLEKFSNCPACLAVRRERMNRMNLEQTLLPPIRCEHCL